VERAGTRDQADNSKPDGGLGIPARFEESELKSSLSFSELRSGFPNGGVTLGTNSKIAALIEEAENGSKSASGPLFAALYSELHGLARRQLARAGLPVTISATTLLHQAYIEMAEREGVSFPDEARFMGYAARVMRGLIIDHARSRRAQKRGGLFEITSFGPGVENLADDRELTRISDALDELAETDAALAEIVDLRFFCGFSFAEIGAMKGISERTAQRQWEKARIYLHRAIRADVGG
jgi:RNA polymerase sigma factor (TIGR02999 family)